MKVSIPVKLNVTFYDLSETECYFPSSSFLWYTGNYFHSDDPVVSRE